MNAAVLPCGGRLDDKKHHLPVRVYYEDTDAAGIVYHASYLRYTERGRSEMMRALEIDLARLWTEEGFVFVLHSAEIKYRKPARLGDLLTVETALTELGAASLKVRQLVLSEAGEVVIFDGLLACTGRDGKPARIPRGVKDKIEAFIV
jgi:acyl-CoA thioester hydrolase